MVGTRFLSLSVAGLVLLSGLAADDAKAQALDVDGWLRRPGVKLLAVEFYATWCKPCMDAVPRWKALHEKYRRQGLRFVVVATQDADGACANPGWAPDDVVCDDEGRLARRFGAQRLPAAFLWSWTGELLAKQVHVDGVDAKITAWMRRTPRVDVDVRSVVSSAGVEPSELNSLVRGELKRADKLVVVATAAERKALRRIVKRSLRKTASPALACEVGAEVSANSLLTATITHRRRPRLQLQLLSAERGCLVASSSTDWRADNPAASVAEAVAELVGRLRRRRTQYPWSTRQPAPTGQSVDYQALLKQAQEAKRAAREAEAKAERVRLQRKKSMEKAWKAVAEIATTRVMPRATRIRAVEAFLRDYPGDNPFLAVAQGYLAQLRAGREPTARVAGMVFVPGGDFFMGCNEDFDSECEADEKPGRRVPVDSFNIDKTEVTVADFRRCVEAGACSDRGMTKGFWGAKKQSGTYCNWGKPARDRHPINCVNWEQARRYCAWADKRLPTEAEWEKAARGTDGQKYPWGNALVSCRHAVFDDQSTKDSAGDETDGCGRDETWPVGSKPEGASPYGALDMIGNVWEWTSVTTDNGAKRVTRGGSWLSFAGSSRASQRDRKKPDDRRYSVGFRCAR